MAMCSGCRVRHLKCDSQQPCSECEKNGRGCVRLNVRFRNLVCPSNEVSREELGKYDFFFDNEQTWVDAGRNLKFLVGNDSSVGDSPVEMPEERTLIAIDLALETRSAVAQQPSRTSALRSTSRTPVPPAFDTRDEPPVNRATVETLQYASPGTITQDQPRMLPYSSRKIAQQGRNQRPDQNIGYRSGSLSGPEEALPLNSLQEARLFQHWVTHLGPWFDVGDSKRHFAKIATCMAATSPLMMTAILAIAALTHSRISGQSDLYDAMTLHDRCLSMIVPMLSDSTLADDDRILMTTTILHLYDGLESGNDLPRHLKGTSIFFPANAILDTSPLRRAVFWLHLRQEIYNAFLHQRPVDTDLSNCRFEAGIECDDMWFHETLYIAALVTQWAFGEQTSRDRWHKLRDMVDDWENCRPTRFSPIHFRAQDPQNGRYFPEICYITNEHVAAAHFFYLSKLLLNTHDPTLPRIGPQTKSAAATMQETALSYVRTLIGIAICNTFIPARFTANLAVMICDDWFTDRGEQEAVLEIIRDTSRRSGWAKQGAENALFEAWGWG